MLVVDPQISEELTRHYTFKIRNISTATVVLLWFGRSPSLPSRCKRRPWMCWMIGEWGWWSWFLHRVTSCCSWSIGIPENLQIYFVEDKPCNCLSSFLFPFSPLLFLLLLSSTILYCAIFSIGVYSWSRIRIILDVDVVVVVVETLQSHLILFNIFICCFFIS